MTRTWTETEVAQMETNTTSLEAKLDTGGDPNATRASARKLKAGLQEQSWDNLTSDAFVNRLKTVRNRLSKF